MPADQPNLFDLGPDPGFVRPPARPPYIGRYHADHLPPRVRVGTGDLFARLEVEEKTTVAAAISPSLASDPTLIPHRDDLPDEVARPYWAWLRQVADQATPIPPADFMAIYLGDLARIDEMTPEQARMRIRAVLPHVAERLQLKARLITAGLAYTSGDGGLTGWSAAVLEDRGLLRELHPRLASAARYVALRSRRGAVDSVCELCEDELTATGHPPDSRGRMRGLLDVCLRDWQASVSDAPFDAWLDVALLPPLRMQLMGNDPGLPDLDVLLPGCFDIAASTRLREFVRNLSSYTTAVAEAVAAEAVLPAPPGGITDELIRRVHRMCGREPGVRTEHDVRRDTPAHWVRPGGVWPTSHAPAWLSNSAPAEQPEPSDTPGTWDMPEAKPAWGDTYLWVRNLVSAGESVPDEMRCVVEHLAKNAQMGLETDDPERAKSLLRACASALPGRGVETVGRQLASLEALEGGDDEWARAILAWTSVCAPGDILDPRNLQQLVGRVLTDKAAERPHDCSQAMLALTRPGNHTVDIDDPLWVHYLGNWKTAVATCFENWHLWTEQTFLAALGTRTFHGARIPLGGPTFPGGERRVPSGTQVLFYDTGQKLLGAIGRQAAAVTRAQADVPQARLRRPALPEGIGDLIADSLGGYGNGGCPFRTLERPPERLFADAAAGAGIAFSASDLSDLKAIDLAADLAAAMLHVNNDGTGVAVADDIAPQVKVDNEVDLEPQVEDQIVAATLGQGWSEPERALLGVLTQPDPVTCSDLGRLFPGVMIEAVLERINTTSREQWGDDLILEEDDALSINPDVNHALGDLSR